jgi:cytochrome c oxidase subunit 3
MKNSRNIQFSHPFHLVESSPWPFCSSFSFLLITLGLVFYFQGYSSIVLFLGVLSLNFILFFWWRDTIRESTFIGYHTTSVQKGLKLGFFLFIVTEILLFASIFWAYFHSSLSPSVEFATLWPPVGIDIINPWELPLLNTIILLSSGASITWVHQAFIGKNLYNTLYGFIFTLILAFLFTSFQVFEYINAPFTIADSIYGSCFFMATGLHALHVLGGSIFLFVALIRIIKYHLTNMTHIGLELAIIYWHFVDVVWIFLFIAIYWWGS